MKHRPLNAVLSKNQGKAPEWSRWKLYIIIQSQSCNQSTEQQLIVSFIYYYLESLLRH